MLECDFYSDGSWRNSGKWKCWFRTFLHAYLYLLHYIVERAHWQIHHWLFWRKSAQDTGSFENGNSFQRKKMTYTIFKWKFTCSTDKPHVIKSSSLQRNQSSNIYFIENIPKTPNNTAHVLPVWREFVLHQCKSIPVVLN